MFASCFPILHTLWDLVSDSRTVVQPVSRCLFLHHNLALFLVRPPNVVQSFLHVSSFHDNVSHRIAVFCPLFVGLPSQDPEDLLPSTPRTRVWLSMSSKRPSWLVLKHVLSILQANHPHVHSHLHLTQSGVQVWPLDAKIECFRT